MTEPRYAALGQAVRTRRAQLGKSQTHIGVDGGPSDVTLGKIEQGIPGSYRSSTLTAPDRALAWKPGTCQAILDGTAGSDPQQWLDYPVPHLIINPAGTTRSTLIPQFEASPEMQTLVARDDTARAGLAFLDLVHRHYGADQQSAKVHSVVTEFLRAILSREHT